MKPRIPHITDGKTECFVVCDHSLKSICAPFYQWLTEEGFTYAGFKPSMECPWIYVNITRRQYSYAIIGVPLVQAIGNHAITISEFMTIYNIYKKYEGKEIFVFHQERFDYNADEAANNSQEIHENTVEEIRNDYNDRVNFKPVNIKN